MNKLVATGKLFGETVTLERITKTQARKLYISGVEVYLQTSKINPFGIWYSVCPIKFDKVDHESSIELNIKLAKWNVSLSPERDSYTQFEDTINEYMNYNCDAERGKYIHYYKKVK